MEEQKNVKWIVIVSLVLFFFSVWLAPSIYLGGYYPSTSSRDAWYYLNRLDILFFIATLTVSSLFTSGFGKREVMYKLTVYIFMISMGVFFLSFSRLLFL